MTLRVVQVPDPPPGQDWAWTVPGIYLYDVTGITATLDTGTGGTPTLIDSSGNHFDGLYTFSNPGDQVLALRQPGLVTGGFSVRLSGGPMGTDDCVPYQPADIAVSIHDDFTLEFLVRLDPGAGQFESPVLLSGGPPVGELAFNPGVNVDAHFPSAVPWTYAAAPIFDNAVHHILFSRVFGVSQELYVDGVALAHLVTSTYNHGPTTTSISLNGSAPVLKGFIDEVAVYEAGLSAGQAAAHYAASLAGQAAYTAAVIGDNPAEYFHLDEMPLATGGGRTPTLTVDDNTVDVLAIPDGFAAVTTPGPYAYSWTPGMSADVQSTDGTLTTVAVPQLLLPGGYVLGTRTLDLQSLDQWSNVNIWWDDAYQNALYGYGRPDYGNGFHLVYHQESSVP